MSRTLNVRAIDFAQYTLFMDSDDKPVSLPGAALADGFCRYRQCEDFSAASNTGCRVHSRAMLTGLSKMVVDGLVYAEMSHRGVVFVRLSPEGVLEPLDRGRVPGWFRERPDLVEWAESVVQRRRWEAKV